MAGLLPEVLIFVGGQEVARYVLGVGVHVFGCSESCHVRLVADGVAPEHARLTVVDHSSGGNNDGGDFGRGEGAPWMILEDLGDTNGGGANRNGTFLDGRTIIGPTRVVRNQTILIGAAQILVLQEREGATAHRAGAKGTAETTILGDESEGEEEGSDGAAKRGWMARCTTYEIGSEIAKGGMGAVYMARQPSIRREVALKVMLRETTSHDRLRFIEEAQITGQLEHPNIVPVHELALNEQDQPFYTMKLMKGGTLKDILERLAQGDAATVARYPLAGLLTVYQKICDAMAYAHARGVIHRDLKPANIMVGDYGEVLVMDWGLAKLVGRQEDRPERELGPETALASIASAREDAREIYATMNGAVMGTPQYMSPEQARGEIAWLDPRSDIFSLGTILYELVTLALPFPGRTTREILANLVSGHFLTPNVRIRSGNAQRPHHLPSESIPDSLVAVIEKALAGDRAERYQTVAELQADLVAYQTGFATAAENAGPWRQARLFIGRHKALSMAIAASFLLIAGLTTAFTMRVVAERNQTAAQRDRAEVEKGRAQTEAANAELANGKFREQLREASRSDQATAEGLFDKGNWSEGLIYLARALQYDPANISAARQLYGSVAQYEPRHVARLRSAFVHGQSVVSANFSPDGRRVVTMSMDRMAQVWDAATGRPLGEPMRQMGARGATGANFSPDGTKVVTGFQDGTAQIWDAGTGKALGEVLRGEPDEEHPNHATMCLPSFSADGRKIITQTTYRKVQVWDATTGKPLGLPLRHGDFLRSARLSPDGSRAVTTSDDLTARIWDAVTGQALGEPIALPKGVRNAEFNPDGSRLVSAAGNMAQIWDAATGKGLGELRHDGFVSSAHFSPDGIRVLTASGDKTARMWDAATGKPLGEPFRHASVLRAAEFSPDGSRIVTTSQEDFSVQVWDVETGKSLGEPLGHGGYVSSAHFSPDGARVVTASEDFVGRVWDAVTGRPPGEVFRTGTRVNDATFSTDGSKLLTTNFESVQIWDVAARKAQGAPMRHGANVASARFSRDGSRVITASVDKTARIWDAATGRPIGEPIRPEGMVTSADFSPDGSQVMTSEGTSTWSGLVQLWNVATGQRIGEPLLTSPLAFTSVSFSPDGRLILARSFNNTAQLWVASTGRLQAELKGHGKHLTAAGFSPDGSKVITASVDKTARLWDAATGRMLGESLGHKGSVSGANFSSEGDRVVTACEDGAARIWDAATGKMIGEPFRHEGLVFRAGFHPNGKSLMTVDSNWTLRFLEIGAPLDPATPCEPWVLEWLEGVSGWRFNRDGALEAVPVPERLALLSSSAALPKTAPADNPWSRLARWVATDQSQRTIHPDSALKFREIAERERDFGSKESLESARRYDSTLPLVRLLLAEFEKDSKRAEFLRDYDLERLPAEAPLWARAARALAKQRDLVRAERALTRLQKIDPAEGQRVRGELGLGGSSQ